MIYSVHGKLIAKEPFLAVVECGGVGYACRTTNNTLSSIGEIGEEVVLYTHFAMQKESVDLFGFNTKQERQYFLMLISVSGVGPKAALSILSDVTPDRFAVIVSSGDVKAFSKIKGIGVKTAQRIVLELKDKISKETINVLPPTVSISAEEENNLEDAISALEVLGYSQEEVMPFLSKMDYSLSSSELIKQTLKMIGKQR